MAAWLLCGSAGPNAAPLDFGDLPGEVQSCVGAGHCTVASESEFERAGVTAFGYGASAGPGYLIRYTLASTSHATDISDSLDTSVEPPLPLQVVQHTPLLGSLWLAVQTRYSATAPDHDLVLYLDHVLPADKRVLPRFLSNEMFPDILHFSLNSAALLAGEARRDLDLDAGTSDGALQGAEVLLPCVADGCSLHQRLALIGFGFRAAGDELVLHFSTGDARREVYFEQLAYASSDNGFDHVRAYFAQPVPLPGTGGALVLASAVLYRTARRGARRQRDTRAWQAESRFKQEHESWD